MVLGGLFFLYLGLGLITLFAVAGSVWHYQTGNKFLSMLSRASSIAGLTVVFFYFISTILAGVLTGIGMSIFGVLIFGNSYLLSNKVKPSLRYKASAEKKLDQ